MLEKVLLKLGQDLVYSSKTEDLAALKSRSKIQHSHQEGKPW